VSRKAAIYHFTDKGIQRPGVCRNQLQALKAFALSKGFDVEEVFCDTSILRHERVEFDRFLSFCEDFDALIVKDFRHINKNTGQCVEVLQELLNKGIVVLTMENGIIRFEEEPLGRPLRVATYNSRFGTPSELKQIVPVQNEVLRLFTSKKTAWKVIDQYFDETEHQANGEQKNLENLINNRERYDLLLVHTLNDIHWRTSNFFRIRERLKLDIYSLQDGYLKYTQEAA